MPKIDQFLQHAKRALPSRYAEWRALSAVSYIFDFDQIDSAVLAVNAVQSDRVSS